MSTEKITLRKDKGSALTYEELDSNFEEYVIFRNKFATVDSSTGIATFPQFSGDNNGKVLYWDNANAKVNVKTLSASDLAAGFGANFNSHLALKTTSDLSEGTNLYYTTARANTDFDSRLATKSTTNLAEGSNLYYTDARVLTKINSTSVRQMQDMPTANVVTDDSKVVTYDATTDSFRYASMLTESLLPVTDHGLITDGNVITGSSGVTTTTLQALTNVNFASVSGAIDGNVLVYDATASEWKAGVVTTNGGVVNTGVTTFSALSDTPANFTGHAGKYVKVNSGETGVEFDALTTDDVTEGTSLFFTNSRFDTRLSAKSTDDLTEGSSNFYYTDTKVDGRIALQVGANLNLGSKTTDHLAEGSTNEYYTTFRANTAIDTRFPQKYIYDLKNVDTPAAGDDQNVLFYDHASTRFKWGQLNDTADLPEGTNLYFTNARADARISAASINALSDVDTATSAPSDGQALVWNASGSKWVPGSAGGSAGGDITAVNAGTGLTGGGVTGSVSFNVDVGATANKIVQLDSSARLPAVDGSQLTNVTPSGYNNTNWDTAYSWGNHASQNYVPNAITDVVQDTTPQLGGHLDTNNKEIKSSSILTLTSTDATNGEVEVKIGSDAMFGVGKISPATFNSVNSIASFQGLASKANANGIWVAGGFNFTDSGVSGSIEGSGVVSSSGDIALVGDIDFTSGVVSGEVIGNLYVDHPTNKSMVDGMMTATVDGVSLTLGITAVDAPMYIMANSGNSNATSVVIGHPNDNRIHILDASGNTIYKLPATDGTAGQVLTTNGNGDLYWN